MTGIKFNTEAIDREIAKVRAQINREIRPLRNRIKKLQAKRKASRKKQRAKYKSEKYAWLKKEPLWRTNIDALRRKMQHRCSHYSHGVYPRPYHKRHYLWRCERSGTVEYEGLHFCKTHISWILKAAHPYRSEDFINQEMSRLVANDNLLQVGKAYGSAL